MSDNPAPSRGDNLRASLWLIGDMSLNIWALSIVKAMGAEYGAMQLVFLRASIGLLLVLPWAWRERACFEMLDRLPLHGLRVGLSVITLAMSFFAIARVPFALFTAVSFVRPILLMIFAALLLGERITRLRWLAALIGLGGALIAINPMGAEAVQLNIGVLALLVTVTTGTLAIILTRRLKGTPTVVMMLFYTGGLTLCTAPFALGGWVPVEPGHWPLLIAIGLFAQAAQYCFLKAHWLGDAGVLGPVSYLSLALSITAGFAFFNEVPSVELLVGAAIILGAAWYVTRAN
ncbi:MAG: DMT family transporter [Devosiaceae bacterium]